MNTFKILRLICLVSITWLLYYPHAVIASEKLNILIIHSYHQDYPWTANQYQGFKKQLANNLNEYVVNFSTEYLDTKNITPSADYKEEFLRYITTKYKRNKPDLIYVTDDSALDFIWPEQQALPWNTPIVYSGINNFNRKFNGASNTIFGVLERKDITGTIDLAKKLLPDSTRIIFLGDGGVTDKAIKNEIKAKQLENKNINFHFIDETSLDRSISQLNIAGDGVVVLTTVGRLKDRNDKLVGLDKILQTIINTDRKILVMEDTYLTRGILGGYVTSGNIQGISAANIASHILRKGNIDDIASLDYKRSEFVLSWSDMERLNVSLPESTIKKAKIINRPPKLTERFPDLLKWLIWFLIILAVILAGFIIIVRQKSQLVKEQYTDLLTGLPNRIRLQRDIKKFELPSLAIFDVNNFKMINTLYGLIVGDSLLKGLSKKILNILSDEYKLYRIGGNQFAIVNKVKMTSRQYDSYFRFLIRELQNIPFKIDELELNLLLTAGVSRNEVEFLIPRAEQALQQAKINNEDYCILDNKEENNMQYKDNLKWAKKLNQALKEDRIVPFFQSITCNKSRTVVKHESLVRLIDGDDVITPFYFLEASKTRRQYSALTKIMIEKTFKVISETGSSISINFSVEDILDKKTILFLKEKLLEFDVADKITIELTENEQIENYHEVSEFVAEIKELGCRIAVDDFGTGYSNFTHLIHLNVDYLKIDGSIIKKVMTDTSSEIVVKTIVEFAHQLGIETIAEFVETKEIFDKVSDLGVDYSQGYYLGKPERYIN